MAGALSKIKKIGKAAEKAKGLGEKAADIKLSGGPKSARDKAIIEASESSKQGFLGPSAVKSRVYHATDKDFSKFNPRLLGEKRGAGTDKVGFWFGDTPESTEFYIHDPSFQADFVEGANIVPAHLQLKNPYRMDAEEFYSLSKKDVEAGERLKANLQKQGFDGVIAETGDGDAYAVFEPTQIKSAIGMKGSYDTTDPDITKAAGGKVDHKLKEWFAAQGGITPDPYQRQQQRQATKLKEIQEYKEGKIGADELLEYYPGLTATMIEAQLNPQEGMAAGGEVRMQAGGGQDEIRRQLAGGVPVFMAPGSQGDIARQMIAQEEAERKRKEEEQAAKVASLPFMDKLRGGVETAQTIQNILGQEVVKPFRALIGGEEAVKAAEERTPLPQTEAGIHYLGKTGEFLAPIGAAIEASKIPDTPLYELVPTTFIPGLSQQIAGMTKRATKAIDKAVPAAVKNLPVGASTEPVGKTVTEVLETTPEAKVQARPEGKIKVEANELGFYSPVEKAAVNIQRKSGPGQAFLNDIMKQPDVKADELEATGLVDWLKAQKNVTKQDVVDYLNSNKLEVVETQRGTVLTAAERAKMQSLNQRFSRGEAVSPEDETWFENARMRLNDYQEPLYDSDDLVIPGGRDYKEIELQFPTKRPSLAKSKSREAYRDAVDEADKAGIRDYLSPHWEDDPNVFAHIRMQDKNIDGKRTLVIEEIQSDWHQEGRDKGYFPKDKNYDELAAQNREISANLNVVNRQRVAANKELDKARFDKSDNWSLVEELEKEVDELDEKYAALQAQFDANIAELRKPPDAPFKENWYQIALKRAVKYAADNDYDQIAIVGGDEQAKRYSLTKKVDAINVAKKGDNRLVNVQTKGGLTIQFNVDKSGIVQEVSDPKYNKALKKPISDVLGKSMGKRLMEMERGTISGEGLNIGGEGMKKYYDEIYPKFLEKQYKKYGVKPQRTGIVTGEYDTPDVEIEETGEVDRFNRPVLGYTVRDKENDEVVGFGLSMDEALAEANRNYPKIPLWTMEVPANLKTDVKIGQPFKKGGAVTKDKALQDWFMAKGGIAGKIAKAAEKGAAKASKRMSREEAEKAGLWHSISETKLAKPVTEYKSTVVEDPSVEMLPRKSISLEELQGGVAIPLAGDRAAAGRIIQEIEGTPMNVTLEGGPDFMRLHPGAAWASGQGVLSMLAKRIKMARESGNPIYGVYTAMSPQAVDFNTMVTESLLNQMDVKDFKKKDIEEFNRAVKAVKGQGGKPKAPNFPGLEDPELREKLMSGPGGQRDAFVKAMAKANFQKKGFPDVAAARLAVTEPELLNIERGSAGYTVAKLDPEGRIFEQSGHTTYPLDLGGEYVGGFESQLPVDVMYPTHFEAKRLMGSKPEGAHKSLELFAPLQYMDQQWLDNAMRYQELQKKLTGRKKGGLARVKN